MTQTLYAHMNKRKKIIKVKKIKALIYMREVRRTCICPRQESC
jgi:hypothetical protein